MRAAIRLLASAQRSSQFLEPGAPTGLTGLLTHPSPRTTLLYLYSSTLEKLKEFPESSVYRQSAEALTKHRLQIIEAAKPAGLEEWQTRMRGTVDEHPEAFKRIPLASSSAGTKEYNIVWKAATAQGSGAKLPRSPSLFGGPSSKNARAELITAAAGSFNGDTEQVMNNLLHTEIGSHMTEEEINKVKAEIAAGLKANVKQVEDARRQPTIEPEPPLTADQINEIETKIGAGLIEEVIQVAEGEKQLTQTLADNQVWEDLEEKPAEGQWVYHERGTHTQQTQSR